MKTNQNCIQIVFILWHYTNMMNYLLSYNLFKYIIYKDLESNIDFILNEVRNKQNGMGKNVH